ncbi:MAG: hypothetical protein H0X37_11115 [Herpetosiphonaceae bacterium]|nr:hypothetical protein [Herpetosiphonaceae bacterium]
MPKSEPFTLRLPTDLDQWVTAEAQRTRRSKAAIIEMLAMEGARMHRFPGIAFRGPEHNRRAWLLGTALDVWEVIEAYQQLGSLESLLSEGDLPERHVRLALSYYAAYPTEIDQAIAANQNTQAALHTHYPTFVPEA